MFGLLGTRLKRPRAMLPYIHIDPIHVGPLTFHAFGFLVATGVLIGVNLATRRAKKFGYDVELLQSFITWILLSGFFFAHALDVVFYHPEELVRRPWAIFLVWESLSSFGGFTGAVIGAVLWMYFEWDSSIGPFGWVRRRETPMPFVPFGDLIVSVFPVSWIFGRTGCSVVHDHPGAITSASNPLSVAYPAFQGDGTTSDFGFFQLIHGSVPRFDLGLLEMLYTVLLVLCLVPLWRRKTPVGLFLCVVPIAYAPVRFFMDFLRIEDGNGADPRYFHLTFAQWSAFALLGYGLYMAKQVKSGSLEALPALVMEGAAHADDEGDAEDGDDEDEDEDEDEGEQEQEAPRRRKRSRPQA